jgi:hypothetical protein
MEPRRERMHGYAYGAVLALILISLGFQLAAPDTGASRVVTILLQSATLLAALRASGVHRWLFRVAAGVVAGRSVGLMLVLLAPAAIVVGVVRQVKATRSITMRTMFGVLCVYLLIGMAFGFLYGIVEAVGDRPFFGNGIDGTQSDFLYFSFATMTTTGYGDLTAATDVGRSVAITEALIGQIYLVTVVAVIVGNLGRGATSARA